MYRVWNKRDLSSASHHFRIIKFLNKYLISKLSNFYDVEHLYLTDFKKETFTEIIGEINLEQLKNIVDEARTTAKDEAAKIAKSSSQQLEQEINSAREKLKADVAEMAIMCAEKIISKEINKKSHDKIIDEVTKQWLMLLHFLDHTQKLLTK